MDGIHSVPRSGVLSVPCYHPLYGYRSRKVGASGKRALVFSPSDGYQDLPVVVPCGGCVGCRLERSRQWAVRCMHEASLSEENAFLTLTYDDDHLPLDGSLVKRDFQLFMKRLRKAYAGKRIRFFHCGEYGDRYGRPHYHAILFGFDFADKRPWSVRDGYTVWRSEELESLWVGGQSELGSVTFESCAYVARYLVKKLQVWSKGVNVEGVYQEVDLEGVITERAAEYVTMSRKPGIGKPWLDKYMCEVYPADSVVMRGRLMKPPRFYDVAHELLNREEAAGIKARRRKLVRPEDGTPDRLYVQELCTEAKLTAMNREG